MSRTLLIAIVLLIVQPVTAQEYFTSGASPDLYLNHKIAAKETWYSLGRTFNLSPKEIAAYNKASINNPLEIGQSIKIPLIAANFTQDEKKAAGESLVPVYHIVQEKEWMYRISVNHNKVPIERLEKWNAISRDEAKAGTRLIVGHLKVRQGNETPGAIAPGDRTTTQPDTAPKQVPATSTARTNSPVTTQTGATAAAGAAAIAGGGYFKHQFENGGKSYSGVAGIFKSTSGWNDGKYYALINNVTVGTIVRITFQQTKKSIFAKVLGELPEMKESQGLAIRISDAAAKDLGAVNSKFSVDIAY